MVTFAPFRIPLARRLQTLAVAHFLFCFLLLAQVCTFLCLYILLFTSYWIYLLPYIIFYIYDWNSQENGGSKRSNWVRNWRVWAYQSDYFPTRLHKTVELDPKRNYLFGIHPHGVLAVSAFTHFTCNGSGFDNVFPGFRAYLAMLPFWFRIPFYREYIMSGGLVSSSKKSIEAVINKSDGGNICCVIPGGAPEALLARPGDIKIILKPRIGFFKVALTNGIPLVPVISFGDHSIWEQAEYMPGTWSHAFQKFLLKYMTFCLPSFHARGIFQYNYGILPYRKSLHTVVGEPILLEKTLKPSSEQLFELQNLYMEKLTKLFEQNKDRYTNGECQLVIT